MNRVWCAYLDNQKELQIRKIKTTITNFHEIGDAWKLTFDNAPTQTIMDLEGAVNKFYKKNSGLVYHKKLTPLQSSKKAYKFNSWLNSK